MFTSLSRSPTLYNTYIHWRSGDSIQPQPPIALSLARLYVRPAWYTMAMAEAVCPRYRHDLILLLNIQQCCAQQLRSSTVSSCSASTWLTIARQL